MFTNITGKSIYYEQRGKRTGIVFVHGLGGSSSVWFAQACGLSAHSGTLAYDWLGSGNSDKPRQPYSVEAWAEEARGLCRELGIERAVFAGHSLGAAVVTTLAARDPELVSALVLLGPVLRLPATAENAIRERAAKVRANGMPAVADVIPAGALAPRTREQRPEVHGLFRAMLLAHDPECYALHCEALLAAGADALAAQVSAPVLLLAGESDPTAPPAAVQNAAALFPNARTEVIADAAHAMQLDQPEHVTRLMAEFLAEKR